MVLFNRPRRAYFITWLDKIVRREALQLMKCEHGDEWAYMRTTKLTRIAIQYLCASSPRVFICTPKVKVE